MPTFGEQLVKLLEAYGITHAFGIPGVHTVELYRGLPASGITHVTPRHEQGAGFMAYGYGIASGKPAACFLITGPGLANAATAMGEARSESAPMLVVATNNETSHLGLDSGHLHATKSQIGIADQVSDSTHQLLAQKNANGVLGRMFSRFHAGRPGPAYLEIPLDLLSDPSAITLDTWPPASRPSPDEEAIRKAAGLLARAERPVILVGGGASDASDGVRGLCELLDCPVVSTTSGKGVLPETHPLSLGASLPFQPVQDYLRDADVVLAIGTEMAETDTLYTYTSYQIDGALIRIDIDLDQLNRNYRPALAILSDAGLALAALKRVLRARTLEKKSRSGASIASGLKIQLTEQWLPGADAHKKVLDILRRVIDDDAVLVSEECQLGYTANQYFECRLPRTYIHPSGYGTLGPAVPAAIGAKTALPERQVVAIVGDGSFLFSVGEMASAAELGQPLPIVMWNSSGYKEIANYMDRYDIERVGVDLNTPDFPTLARSFNCHGARPNSADEFEAALRQALTAQAPTLIELKEGADWLG
ncbi:MAG: 5-guanidino-2-oxopentanoate decarboxylase [Pseudomonadota bacterium]